MMIGGGKMRKRGELRRMMRITKRWIHGCEIFAEQREEKIQ
jgi:hypothetical protein